MEENRKKRTDLESTQFFRVQPEQANGVQKILSVVYEALSEKGYDPVNQIVGFPGETEEEFDQTCAFLERIRFYEIHVFRYSRRSGTVADKMPDQVPEPVKARRSERLLALTAAQAAAYRAQFAGEPETILLEETCEQDGVAYWTGSTARYVTAAVPADGGQTYRPGMILRGTFRPEEIGLSRGSCLLFVPEI